MSCLNYDWKAYVLGELNANDRRDAESHAAQCAACRDELASTRLTLDALSTLREEEVPRRIAFVSDKVFEPKWWQAFFKPSLAGALAIAVAILVHAAVIYARPSSPAIAAEINAAVTRAIAASDQRHAQELQQILADYDIVAKQNMLMYAKNSGIVRQ